MQRFEFKKFLNTSFLSDTYRIAVDVVIVIILKRENNKTKENRVVV